jgi:hypothetical protein
MIGILEVEEEFIYWERKNYPIINALAINIIVI